MSAKKTAGEDLPLRKSLTGPASPRRSVCAPAATAISLYRRPHQQRRLAMFPFSWLWNRTAISRATHCAAPRHRQVRFRPKLELLEDRAVPAILSVTTTLDVVNAYDGLLSLREAVLEAHATPDASTITLPAGTYALAHSADLDLTGNLTIQGAGAGSSVIDAAESRVFDVGAGAHVTLSGMTVQGGTEVFGGGIFIDFGASVTISNTAVSNNFADGAGGGIFNLGTLTINNSTLANNSTSNVGGAVWSAEGNLMIRGSTISGNSARLDGGGIWLGTNGNAMIVDSTLFGNTAVLFSGGGIFGNGSLAIVNSSLFGNSAGLHGGGIYNVGDVSLTNSSVTGNSAGSSGGGIANVGSLTVRASAVLYNTAALGGDIYNAAILYLFASAVGDLYEV
jgi:hypothetical protein